MDHEDIFVDAGLIVMTAFISPFREDRDVARKLLKEGEFIEVHVNCSLSECERRDPKGIYKKARTGEIREFTGISSPYEEPEKPELVLETDKLSLNECVENLLEYLSRNEYIKIQPPFRLDPLHDKHDVAIHNLYY